MHSYWAALILSISLCTYADDNQHINEPNPFALLEEKEALRLWIDARLSQQTNLETLANEAKKKGWKKELFLEIIPRFIQSLTTSQLVALFNLIQESNPDNIPELIEKLSIEQLQEEILYNLQSPTAQATFIEKYIRSGERTLSKKALQFTESSLIIHLNNLQNEGDISLVIGALSLLPSRVARGTVESFILKELARAKPESFPSQLGSAIALYAVQKPLDNSASKSVYESIIDNPILPAHTRSYAINGYAKYFPDSTYLLKKIKDPSSQKAVVQTLFQSSKGQDLLHSIAEDSEQYDTQVIQDLLARNFAAQPNTASVDQLSPLERHIAQRNISRAQHHISENGDITSFDRHIFLSAYKGSTETEKSALTEAVFKSLSTQWDFYHQLVAKDLEEEINYINDKLKELEDVDVPAITQDYHLDEKVINEILNVDLTDSHFTRQNLSRALLLVSIKSGYPKNLLAAYLMAFLGHVSTDGEKVFIERTTFNYEDVITDGLSQEEYHELSVFRTISYIKTATLHRDLKYSQFYLNEMVNSTRFRPPIYEALNYHGISIRDWRSDIDHWLTDRDRERFHEEIDGIGRIKDPNERVSRMERYLEAYPNNLDKVIKYLETIDDFRESSLFLNTLRLVPTHFLPLKNFHQLFKSYLKAL